MQYKCASHKITYRTYRTYGFLVLSREGGPGMGCRFEVVSQLLPLNPIRTPLRLRDNIQSLSGGLRSYSCPEKRGF